MVRLLQAAIAAVNIDRDGLIRSLGSVWRSVIAAELDKAKVAAASCYSAAAEGLGSCSSVEEAEALHKVRHANNKMDMALMGVMCLSVVASPTSIACCTRTFVSF